MKTVNLLLLWIGLPLLSVCDITSSAAPPSLIRWRTGSSKTIARSSTETAETIEQFVEQHGAQHLVVHFSEPGKFSTLDQHIRQQKRSGVGGARGVEIGVFGGRSVLRGVRRMRQKTRCYQGLGQRW